MGFKRLYEPGLRETEHGQRLYHYWKIARKGGCVPEFSAFTDFYEWAMHNGYTDGSRLFRKDISKPFSPDNCVWKVREEWIISKCDNHRDREREREWDNVVNRIRRNYGMKPIYSSEV